MARYPFFYNVYLVHCIQEGGGPGVVGVQWWLGGSFAGVQGGKGSRGWWA